jgi:hypothetical protein
MAIGVYSIMAMCLFYYGYVPILFMAMCLLYLWLSVVLILMANGSYSIGGRWCLLMVIILVVIGGYCTNGYLILFYKWLLVFIL